MAKSDTSEKKTTYQKVPEPLPQTQAEPEKPLETLPPTIQETTVAPVKTETEAADTANNAEIQHVEAELVAMLGKAGTLEAEATRLANESGDNASTEVNQARCQAAAMCAAAKQAQTEISSAPTEKGKKRISSAKLKGITDTIAVITTEAEQETRDLGAATTEARAHNANRATAKSSAAAKSTPASRLSTAFLGGQTAGYSASHGRDDDEHFITTVSGGHQRHTLRKVLGQGADRSIVQGLSIALGEQYADETVATVKTGVVKMTDGYVAMWKGDRSAADRAARESALGYKNVIHDVGIDYLAAAVTNTVGLNKAAEMLTGDANIAGSVSQNIGRTAHNVLWVGGRIGSAPMYYAKEAGAAVSEYIWGAPVPNAAKAIAAARAKVDSNHDGKLSKDEMMAALAKVGKTLAQANVDGKDGISNLDLAITLGTYPTKTARTH